MCNVLLAIFLLLVFNVVDDTEDFLCHQHLCHACLQIPLKPTCRRSWL